MEQARSPEIGGAQVALTDGDCAMISILIDVGMHRHELSGEQWAAVEAVVPRRVGRPSKVGDRHIVNAVSWIAKAGSPWRDLHPRFGPWKTV